MAPAAATRPENRARAPGRSSCGTPSFSGAIDAGFVYGRGALDDKSAVIAILEAAEKLLGAGHRPLRTVYLAFGGDEEVGGDQMARAHGTDERISVQGLANGVGFYVQLVLNSDQI